MPCHSDTHTCRELRFTECHVLHPVSSVLTAVTGQRQHALHVALACDSAHVVHCWRAHAADAQLMPPDATTFLLCVQCVPSNGTAPTALHPAIPAHWAQATMELDQRHVVSTADISVTFATAVHTVARSEGGCQPDMPAIMQAMNISDTLRLSPCITPIRLQCQRAWAKRSIS